MPAADNVPGSGVIDGDLFIMGGGNPFSQTAIQHANKGSKRQQGSVPDEGKHKGRTATDNQPDGLLRSRHEQLDEWQPVVGDGIVPSRDQRR